MHIKIVPRYNDDELIQHADDQIHDSTEVVGSPHEVPGHPVGQAIESYQGFLTCEVWHEEVLVVDPYSGSGLVIYAAEALCEATKMVDFDPADAFVHFVFRLRTAWGSSDYIDIDQYVYIVNHEYCGILGEPDTDNPFRGRTTTTAAPTTLPHVTTLVTTSTSISSSATTAGA